MVAAREGVCESGVCEGLLGEEAQGEVMVVLRAVLGRRGMALSRVAIVADVVFSFLL